MKNNWKTVSCRNQIYNALEKKSEKLKRSVSSTLEIILEKSLKKELEELDSK